MNHDSEQLAAAYLTAMRPGARRRFEEHLLECDPCWQEVCLARRGRLVGAARGELGGVAVTMFAYRTRSGARLTIFRSSQPFPEASEARELGGTEGAWTVRSSGVTIICAQGTHTMLLLGSDATLVRQA